MTRPSFRTLVPLFEKQEEIPAEDARGQTDRSALIHSYINDPPRALMGVILGSAIVSIYLSMIGFAGTTQASNSNEAILILGGIVAGLAPPALTMAALTLHSKIGRIPWLIVGAAAIATVYSSGMNTEGVGFIKRDQYDATVLGHLRSAKYLGKIAAHSAAACREKDVHRAEARTAAKDEDREINELGGRGKYALALRDKKTAATIAYTSSRARCRALKRPTNLAREASTGLNEFRDLYESARSSLSPEARATVPNLPSTTYPPGIVGAIRRIKASISGADPAAPLNFSFLMMSISVDLPSYLALLLLIGAEPSTPKRWLAWLLLLGALLCLGAYLGGLSPSSLLEAFKG